MRMKRPRARLGVCGCGAEFFGPGRFCSMRCSSLAQQGASVEQRCRCGVLFRRLETRPRQFCSMSCRRIGPAHVRTDGAPATARTPETA
jgi:hypothetical protein